MDGDGWMDHESIRLRNIYIYIYTYTITIIKSHILVESIRLGKVKLKKDGRLLTHRLIVLY